MADNPITKQLPADLPTNWSYGQTVAPSGAEAGLSAQHGYNYLMQQVNAAQNAINQVGDAFEDLATKDVTDGLQKQINQKVPNTRKVNNKPLSADVTLTASDVGADLSGSAQAVQTNLNNHATNTTIHTTAAEKSAWNTNTVHTLGYSKSGTVHQLTGLTGLSGTLSCVFKATAAFAAGDTFTVDGVAYAVQLSNGEAAEDNLFVNGASILIVVDTAGKKVNFKKAGGKKLPAGTVVLKTTVSTTFVVPEDGNYKVIVVGHGGQGANSNYRTEYENGTSVFRYGGGAGSGGVALGIFKLKKGESYTVTVANSVSSFGSLISAIAGEQGAYWHYNTTFGEWRYMDYGHGGTATGGSYNSSGMSGIGPGKVTSENIFATRGGSGGAYTTTNKQHISFLSTTRLRGHSHNAGADYPKDTDVGLGGGGRCDSDSIPGTPGANGLVLVEKA